MIPSIELHDEPIGLLVATHETTRGCYVLTRSLGKILVGRHPTCDIQIGGAQMSRQHFAVTPLPAAPVGDASGTYQFLVENLSDVNRAKLNEEPLNAGFLKDGDVITAGGVSFRFCSLIRR